MDQQSRMISMRTITRDRYRTPTRKSEEEHGAMACATALILEPAVLGFYVHVFYTGGRNIV